MCLARIPAHLVGVCRMLVTPIDSPNRIRRAWVVVPWPFRISLSVCNLVLVLVFVSPGLPHGADACHPPVCRDGACSLSSRSSNHCCFRNSYAYKETTLDFGLSTFDGGARWTLDSVFGTLMRIRKAESKS